MCCSTYALTLECAIGFGMPMRLIHKAIHGDGVCSRYRNRNCDNGPLLYYGTFPVGLLTPNVEFNEEPEPRGTSTVPNVESLVITL